jgi:hypothetical protein
VVSVTLLDCYEDGQFGILQTAVAFLQAQAFEQLHRREFGVAEYRVQIPGRDVRGFGDSVRVERGVTVMPADDLADACPVQQPTGGG